ncbi:MAG: hypothetical protein MJE66_10375 [Proteobacteria bacterium]|nr:hypothetical protein [Pseudomonadota bacterium]
MADSTVFDRICEALEAESSLDRLEARGTMRLALKQAGLEARHVTRDEMGVVIEKVLPAELTSRGIDDATGVCARLGEALAQCGDDGDRGESPESVFARLGGN